MSRFVSSDNFYDSREFNILIINYYDGKTIQYYFNTYFNIYF
jgi:hypothetical protein